MLACYRDRVVGFKEKEVCSRYIDMIKNMYNVVINMRKMGGEIKNFSHHYKLAPRIGFKPLSL